MKECTLISEIEVIRELLIDSIVDVLDEPNTSPRMTMRADQDGVGVPHCWVNRGKYGPTVHPVSDLTPKQLDNLMLATNIGDRRPCFFYSGRPTVLSYPLDHQTLH